MKPTDILKQEHRVIEQVLNCLEAVVKSCSTEKRLDARSATEMIDFFRNFADRCHHGKEEDQLFPMMERRGFPAQAGPIGVMRSEHEQGRALIRGMEQSIDGAAAGSGEACHEYARHALGYVEMLRAHIQKEDHCLFPMADEALTGEDQQRLQEIFERVEREEIGADVHERYVRLADELAERLEVPKARPVSDGAPRGCTGRHG